jgi:hypothetical protein
MSIKMLFTMAAVLTAVLGVAWLFAPAFMLADLGITGDTVDLYMGRRYGGMFFGYCTLLWLARGASASPARRAIVAGGFAVTAVLAVVSTIGVAGGIVGPHGWVAVVIEALLAIGFGSHLLRAQA